MKCYKRQKTVAWMCAASLAAGLLGGMPAAVLAEDAAETSVTASVQLSDAQVEAPYANASVNRVSVHDPSIISNGSGTYYVFGSHMGVAKSTDLQNWESVTSESTSSTLYGTVGANQTVTPVSYENAFTSNAYTGNVTLANGTQTALGTYNIKDWIAGTNADGTVHSIQGNMWAPDVIYNEEMEKWCMYQSLNGNNWNSAIVLLTADQIEGPYVYQGPVVFTGFDSSIPNYTVGDADRSFKDTDLELVLGEMSSIPSRYVKGSSWGTFWPHAIDPCVTYDASGNLWLIYGSWSGGIYALELDEETGLRDYTVTYASDYDSKGAKVTTDPYFGKKIAGGYYVSGEGPYVEKIGNYYYLFLSYGFYSSEGGYEMRVFRSSNIDGPYTDTTGASAIYNQYQLNYSQNAASTKGMKVMGNYQWDTMNVAEIAQGHNSAFVDTDGQAYVIYHTKFNNGTEGHQLRVHQLFLNEDGWFVTAPYEYSGETTDDADIASSSFTASQIAGDYELIVHKYNTKCVEKDGETEVVTPIDITLNADGTVTGEATGTWSETAGTSYITLTLDGRTYKGVLAEQTIDGSNVKTLCFTALCQATGVNIWGSKVPSDDIVVAKNVKYNAPCIPGSTMTSFPVSYEALDGASVQWTSSNPSVLTADGVVTRPAADTVVTLTRTITKGNYYYVETYPVTVLAQAQTANSDYTVGTYYTSGVNLSTGLNGSISIPNPFYQYSTYGLDISNGATIAFDVQKTGDLHMLGTIFGFLADGGDGGRLYFTPGSYLGYNANGSYFDANIKNFGLVQDYIGDSAHVSIQFTDSGFTVQVNGQTAYTEAILNTENGSGSVEDYSDVLNWLQNEADTIYFGYGSWWNAVGYDEANCTISNVTFTAGPASAPDYFSLDQASLTSNSYIEYYSNPLYGKNVEELYVQYTINWAQNAVKNGWDGLFSFYNSSTEGRVSFQSSPFLDFNNANGTWKDMKNDSLIGSLNKGQDYTVTWIITSSKAEVYLDGVKLALTETGGGSYSDILSYISTCDKITVGVGLATTAYWYTELCELSDLYISCHVPDADPYTKNQVTLASSDAITYEENPLYGKELDSLLIQYTINWNASAAKNGWDGIFSFWDGNGGRVSFQTAPYICWNGGGKWMDINKEGTTAASLQTGRDYTFTIRITSSGVEMDVDGTAITGFPVATSGADATYAGLLDFISSCPQITWGVGKAVTSYWWTELCTLKNITFAPAYLTVEAENGSVTGWNPASLTNTLTAAASSQGGQFLGWYNGNTLLSTNLTETFTVCEPVTLTAKFAAGL